MKRSNIIFSLLTLVIFGVGLSIGYNATNRPAPAKPEVQGVIETRSSSSSSSSSLRIVEDRDIPILD